MVPLDPAAAREVMTRLDLPAEPGLLALKHALTFRGPGLWGDAPLSPRSVILIREGDGQLEAFGAGEPEPAVGWLVGHHRGFSLLAPGPWLDAVRERVGEVDESEVETWSSGPRSSLQTLKTPQPSSTSRVLTRLLTARDLTPFNAVAPSWALRGWRSYPALIDHGAAFGVPHGPGFAALAWVFDQADRYDSVGIYTVPRYRRLGLARAAASALCDHILQARKRRPLWSTPAENDASRALASSLGFTPASVEPLLRWPPRAKVEDEDEDA